MPCKNFITESCACNWSDCAVCPVPDCCPIQGHMSRRADDRTLALISAAPLPQRCAVFVLAKVPSCPPTRRRSCSRFHRRMDQWNRSQNIPDANDTERWKSTDQCAGFLYPQVSLALTPPLLTPFFRFEQGHAGPSIRCPPSPAAKLLFAIWVGREF